MNRRVGIDVGTTWTAAAISRDGSDPEILALDHRSTSIPSVVFFPEDGEPVVGFPAERRSHTDPHRVARHPKRRLGDTTPMLLGGSPHSPQSILGHLIRWVHTRVTEMEGAAPDTVAVTHPANWGPFKIDLLREAMRFAGLDDAASRVATEPEAAAAWYAAQERLAPGSIVAVYDLGGGTFDAVALRRTEEGFDFVGPPRGVEHLGGIDFDEALTEHVLAGAGIDIRSLDPTDDAAMSALARLRTDVVEAKEALSEDTAVSIQVLEPLAGRSVRVTREEFEGMIEPAIRQTVDVLRRCLDESGVEPSDLTAVLLVGGSSRVPLVARTVSAALDRPIAVDAHPKHAVALGAAMAAGDGPKPAAASPPASPPGDEAPEPAGASPPARGPAAVRPGIRLRWGAISAAALAVAAVVTVPMLLSSDDPPPTTSAGTVAPTTTAVSGSDTDLGSVLTDFGFDTADVDCIERELGAGGADTSALATALRAFEMTDDQRGAVDEAFDACSVGRTTRDFADPAARGELAIPAGFPSCRNLTFGFAISHPPDWSHSAGETGNGCRIFLDTSEGSFETDQVLSRDEDIFFPIYILVSNLTAEEVMEAQLDESLLDEGDRFSVVDQSSADINGVDGVRFEWTIVLEDGRSLINNNVSYILTHEGTTFEIFMGCCIFHDEATFEQIARSFRPLDL